MLSLPTFIKMKRLFYISIALGLSLWSCDPKQFNLSNAELDVWKPLMALPLFETNISVNDMMEARDGDSYLKLNDEEGFLSFVYRGQLLEYKFGELIKLEAINKSINFQIAAGVYPPSGQISVTQEFVIPIGNGTDHIYKVWLKNGVVAIKSNSQSPDLGKFIIGSQQIRTDGSPFLFEAELGKERSQNLAGYVLDLTKTSAGEGEFKVRVEYKISGAPGTSYSAANIQATIFMGLFQYDKIYCHVKPRKVVDLQDSFNIPFFKLENIEGGVDFLSPRLRFYTQNSFGGSATIAIDKMMGTNGKGESKNVKFNTGDNQAKIKRPPSEGMVGKDQVDLNIHQSFSEVLSISPEKFYFENAIYLNDDGNPDTNYIMDTSRMVLQSEIEIPLQLKFRKFDFSSVVDANFSNMLMDDFEFIKFQFDMINKFPIELRFQLHFLDDNGVILDSLFATGNTLFRSGIVGEKWQSGT